MQSLKAQQLAALRKRAHANREKLGPQTRPGRPGLSPWQRCSSAHVTALDLVDFPRDLRSSHRKELLRRRQPRRTPPADVLLLELLALFNGVKPGGGAKLQVPLELEQDVTGYGESTLQAAHARLVRKKFIFRDEEMRELEWVDGLGRRHYLCQVWSKMRITAAGLEHLRSLGESKREIIPVGPQRARITVVGGLSWGLLKACGPLLRLLARRFASTYEKKTPPLRGETQREEEPVSATGAAPHPSATSPPNAGARGSTGGGRAYILAEFERHRSEGNLTASQGYRSSYWNVDRRGRRELEQAFEEIYRPALHRWFVANATHEQQLIQQARLETDAAMLEVFEAAEPSEAEKRRRYHDYGERWRPRGRATPGGDWVSAGASSVEELKKQQAADRAEGRLGPKKKRRSRA